MLDDNNTSKHQFEQDFHDEWADGVDISSIDVCAMNEVCTAPEMRYITKKITPLKGKTVLDVGCGLGEASVYFAIKGANVTAVDISRKMLEATKKLSIRNGVTIETYHSSIDSLQINENRKFDIIYAGNFFHHVDIDKTLKVIVNHVKKNGVLVSWDPLAYNPIINIYRKIASKVRTPDEHPITLGDINLLKNYFDKVEIKWFWFTTLLVFIIMAIIQQRDPNKERFWKKVLEEADKWKWIYNPLEYVDKVLLKIFPFLGPLCWNVVIVARNPRTI